MTADPSIRFIRVGPIKTRFRALGDSGTPVVLLHGLGDSAEIWKQNFEALAAAHRVFAPDLPGFGYTDKPDIEYTPEVFRRFIGEFLSALDIGRCHLVGHSLGGGLALQYTLTHPDQVEKLVLVSSAGLGPETTWPLRLSTLPFLGPWVLHPARRVLPVFFRRLVYDPAVITDDFVELRYGLLLPRENRRALLKILRSLLTLRGVRPAVLNPLLENLGSVRAPTLIVWGTHDRILPLRHAHRAKAGIPDAVLHVFDKCGHMPNYEYPEKFNGLVTTFLRG
ncbi:MAG TPA: alpha/beta fold hydrolase [Syntrophales bacterium]|jgi:4,5:9,10-diseco-3-hydroxy-5,9,17-trioxoandrosta-1(10),2-diene-4-oate hydrolase|nr:alpha/beta fold hydrolase [Syntrophales bacterium]HRT61282.1 alpha/beta fold hydrolase [Syntrophales bacterium]